MDRCDVLIVGGGPAGSSCAWKLRQAGIEVVVLDKATFPRHKVCGGWITPPILQELQLDAEEYGRQRTLQPITRFITGFIAGRELETVYDRPVSYGIRRSEFDHFLLARSQARLRLGEGLHSLRREGGDWIVNDAVAAPFVVGAGGHFCPVARQFAAGSPAAAVTSPDLPTVVAQEVEFEMSESHLEQCSAAGERPELYFCPDLKGYGWIFRKGNFLNVGLGREGESNLSMKVDEFVHWLTDRGKIPSPLPERFRGHAYHLRTALRPAVPAERLLLIGDALGLAERQSGEGIRPAVESGLLAAASILEALARPACDLRADYQRRLQSRFPQTPSLATWLPEPLRTAAARWLMAAPWFARHVLLDRWFLHAHQPTLRG
ncbi:MAG: NAD(P)/FAD-dependent oxidoreductase [Planctomycetaceae bacterium]|nr:NAD(P)/FAD-dependent oxidoreductase [Planctomycetaceae bacterium]